MLFLIVATAVLFYLQIKNDSKLGGVQNSSGAFSKLFQQLKAHYQKAAATQKLLLSFVQVLVGVQFYLKVEWPEKFTNMLNKFSLNMFQAVSATNSCNAVESYYYLELILWFCAPIAITLLLTVIGLGMYFCLPHKHERGLDEQKSKYSKCVEFILQAVLVDLSGVLSSALLCVSQPSYCLSVCLSIYLSIRLMTIVTV
jgi:hypothetical protein